MGPIDGFKLALIVVSAVAVVASVVEAAVLWRLGRPYDWREGGASLAIAFGREVTNLLPLAGAPPGGFLLFGHPLWTGPPPTPLGSGVVFPRAWFFLSMFA